MLHVRSRAQCYTCTQAFTSDIYNINDISAFLGTLHQRFQDVSLFK